MLRRSSQSKAPRHRDGFGSAAHVRLYATRFYVAGLVYSHGGQSPLDVRETLLEECAGHLRGVARFRGVPWPRIKLLGKAAKKAIAMALKDYKTAGPQWSDRQLGWMILCVQNGPYLDAMWGAEEHAVVRRFLRSVPELDVDRGTVTIVALRYPEDPRDYHAAIAQGLSEAGYIRQAVRRHKEEARILRIRAHRFQDGIAETEKVLTCAPDPFEDYSLQSDVQRATHPSRVSEPANSRFEHLQLWVPDETDRDQDRRARQDKNDELLVTGATEAQELCRYMRRYLKDGEDYAAIRH
jgi:hypothetical protein